MHDELHITKKASSSVLATSIPRVGGGSSGKKKRNLPPSPQLYRREGITIPIIKQLLDAYTDEHYKEIIQQLSGAWQETIEKGKIVTKRQMKMTLWGEYKDDHNALQFQQAIRSTREHPQTVTQYDTLLAQSIATHNDV